jgi:hypothetical protein
MRCVKLAILVLGSALGLGACTRAPEGQGSEPATPSARAQLTTSPAAADNAHPSLALLAHAESVVAIGDLHGDLAATRRALRLAGAIDDHDAWVGGKLVVVQTGDVLDRGDDDRAVLDFLERLRSEAERAGGHFIPMSGNHEVMNVARDFRYVTPGSFRSFGGTAGRAEAFAPGGSYARLLSGWPVVVKVGDTVFVHGGMLLKHALYGMERINAEVAAYMRGERPAPPEIVVSDDGPIWTRRYSSTPSDADCDELSAALMRLGATRMVVGHTPQSSGINAACGGRVWRIDVGMARAYGGPAQVLVLERDQVIVRKLPVPDN